MTTRPPGPRRGSWALRDRPGLVWLGLAVLLSLLHPFVPAATWLLVHLVLLGALTHSAVVWSTHFTQALLKTSSSLDERPQQNRRIGLLVAGQTAVLVGVPTSLWPLTLAGAVAVSTAVVWHGIQLWRRLRHALPGRFRVTVRYYLAAAACVPVGAGLGAWLARGLDDVTHGRVLVAHSMVMVLGWIGLTVTGTLVTLWPTMLRTRMDDRAERLARQALPVLVIAVGVVGAGALAGSRAAALVGLTAYAGGLAWWGRALLAPARTGTPAGLRDVVGLGGPRLGRWSPSACSPGSVATAGTWAEVADGYGVVAAVVAVGFAAQLLAGALSHLVPTVLGGGPSVVRAGSAELNRVAVLRVTVINLGLLVCLLPVPSAVRVAASTLVLVALAAFIPLLLRAVRAAVTARTALIAAVAEADEHSKRPQRAGPEPRVWSSAQLVAGVASIALAVTLGVAFDPAAAGLAPDAAGTVAGGGLLATGTVTPTGETTRVRIEARDMAFSPASITVPVGNRLVIELVNVDEGSPHDLSFGGDVHTPRVMPGRSATLDAGVVGGSGQGWCTIVGHRPMGMVLDVVVEGGSPQGTDAAWVTDASATDHGIRLGQEAGCLLPRRGCRAATPGRRDRSRGHPDRGGGRARDRARRAPEAVDLRRFGPRPDPARARR